MSILVQQLVMGTHMKALSGGNYIVAIAMAARADDAGKCWPSLELIAQEAHVTETTVLRAHRRFLAPWSETEPRALLTKVSKKTGALKAIGRGDRNEYVFNLSLLRALNLIAQQEPGWRKTADANTDIESFTELEEIPTLSPGEELINTNIQSSENPTSSHANTDIESLNTNIQSKKPNIQSSLYRRTIKEPSVEPSLRTVTLTPASEGKKFALSLMGQLNDLTDETLRNLANQIAVRHPRSRLRNWTERNVGHADRVAVLEAMQDEAQQTGVTMAAAGRMMLDLLDAWDEIPREKWQFVAAIPKFYKQGDYRLQPNEVPGMSSQEGRKANGKRRGTEGNDDVVREFLESTRNPAAGDHAFAEGAGGGLRQDGDCGDASALLGGVERGQPGRDRVGVQPSGGGVQVLPAARIPARIQWPRRNG